MNFPGRIKVVEVGPARRLSDGEGLYPDRLKVEVIEVLADSGLQEIEAVSFVHPRVISANARRRRCDVPAVTSAGRFAIPPWCPTCEAPNALWVQKSTPFIWSSAVQRPTTNARGNECGRVAGQPGEHRPGVGGRVPVAATMAATFGCPFEGQLPDDDLVDLAERIVDAGATEVGLADSAGLGNPLLVRRVVGKVSERISRTPLRMHLHDTRGLGLANAVAALELGVAAFDTSLGGLGGCPVMKGASGNVSTEDFVNLCNEIGVESVGR